MDNNDIQEDDEIMEEEAIVEGFVCEQCSKTFKSQNAKNSHMRIHKNETHQTTETTETAIQQLKDDPKKQNSLLNKLMDKWNRIGIGTSDKQTENEDEPEPLPSEEIMKKLHESASRGAYELTKFGTYAIEAQTNIFQRAMMSRVYQAVAIYEKEWTKFYSNKVKYLGLGWLKRFASFGDIAEGNECLVLTYAKAHEQFIEDIKKIQQIKEQHNPVITDANEF